MTLRDWLWLFSLALGAFIAWQNKNIENAVLSLKLELSDRIARVEGDLKETRAMVKGAAERL